MAQGKKKNMIDRKYHLFNAEGKILGRLATEVATILIGKDKVAYAPHIDGGDFVVIINSDKVDISGNKREDKIYHHFSGYPGGVASIAFKDQLKKDSRKLIAQAVYGMLPKNSLRDRMTNRLLVYKDAEQKHTIHVTHE